MTQGKTHVILEIMKKHILETQRLILRPVDMKDAPAIQKYFNNWDIIKNLSTKVPWPYPDDGAETFLRDNALPRMRDKDHIIWGLVPKDGPEEVIGLIDFGKGKSDHGERGFWIATEFHGQGLMTEAVSCVNDYIFDVLDIEEYTVVNAITNERSRRVKEKTGAIFIGYGELEHHSGDSKSEIWRVTREEWIKTRNKN